MAHPKTMVIEIGNVSYVFKKGYISCDNCLLYERCTDVEDRSSIDVWLYCAQIEGKTGHMYNCQEVINGRY